MITISDLHLTKSERPIFQGLHLRCKAGEKVALMGASGSGKSTLLRAICGFERPDQGTITLEGRCATHDNQILIPPHDRNLSMIFQDLALWDHMSVGENITFVLKMRHTPPSQIKDAVEAILDRVDLAGYSPRRIESLSGGEKQRVALARSLVTHPKILLMDEPLSSLDEARKTKLITLINDLHQEHRFTLLYVTHSHAEAETIADRVLLLKEGKISES